MKYGFIYCMGNEAMPGIYKIGMTERAPSQRCAELSSSTSAPLPFDLLFYGEVEDPCRAEREIHDQLYLERLNDSREFFRGPLESIYTLMKEYCSSFASTFDGERYLAVEMTFDGMKSVASDADRVEIFTRTVQGAYGITMWADGEQIRFSCPECLIPRWVTHASALSKSTLLQHLPSSSPAMKSRALVLVREGEE